MKALILLSIIVLLIINNAIIYGQICDRSKQPVSFLYDSYKKPLTKETALNTKNMGYINKDSLLAEDELHKDANTGFRFGFVHEVQFNLKNSGTWDTLDNGDRIWRLRIVCPEAYSTNLIFSKFYLPEGSMLFLYNEEKNSILGALTSRNNRESKTFATSFIQGDSCIIEYYEPFQSITEGEIEISTAVHGYVNLINDFSFNQKNDSENSSGSRIDDDCEVNVKCPEGDDWEKEIYSICRIYYLDYIMCTGSLINNTNQDCTTPYILTGNHCRSGPDYFQYWMFEFGFFKDQCNNGVIGNTRTFSGAEYRASWNKMDGTDFLLLELIETPETDNVPFQLYYNGWDRRNIAPETSVCLHHPGGRDMKISIANNTALATSWTYPAFNTDCIPDNSNIKYWMVSFDIGITKSGSSGSPLFNPDKKVIGQSCHTTIQQCSTGVYGCDFFGKFSISWDGNGTNNSRLSNWLDPIGSNVQTLDGKYPTVILRYGERINTTTDWNSPCVFKIGSSYSSQFRVNPGGDLTIKAGKEIVIRPCTVIASGSEFLAHIGPLSPVDYVPPTHQETIYNPNMCDTIYSPPKENMMEQVYQFFPNSVSIKPNPFTEETRISITLGVADIVTLEVYDILGNCIATLAENVKLSQGSYDFKFSGSNINSGVYHIIMTTQTEKISKPLLLIK